MKKTAAFLFFFSCASALQAQNIAFSAIVSGGGASPALSYSVGDLFVNPAATAASGSGFIGLLQNFYTITGIEEDEAFRNITLYPNPTLGEIWVQGDDTRAATSAHLFDYSGRQIAAFDLSSGQPINLQNHTEGLYLIKLSDKQNRIIKSFRIVKQ